LELLQRVGRRSGSVVAMAKRLGVHRATLWRHRKEHLKIFVSKKPVKLEGLSFEERARLLAMEADRLQVQLENGAPRDVVDGAMRTLTLRVKLLEMESKFSGKPLTQKKDEIESLEDPEEEAKALREFQEVCGETEA
jgi:predicted metalloprotease